MIELNDVRLEKALKDALNEISKAEEKFPTWPQDAYRAVAVLGEEYGELLQALNEFTYEDKSTYEDVKKEAIQTAAMAIRFLKYINEYTFDKGFQIK